MAQMATADTHVRAKRTKPRIHPTEDQEVFQVAVEDVPDNLALILRRIARDWDKFLVVKDGKPVAAIVPADCLKVIVRFEDVHDTKMALDALDEAEREGTIPWEKVKADLGL